jgi:hypothetical protein
VLFAGGREHEHRRASIVGSFGHFDIIERHDTMGGSVAALSKVVEQIARKHEKEATVAHGVIGSIQLARFQHLP